jgi:hypothetical protein
VTEIQRTLLDALQLQPADVLTNVLPGPPPAPNDAFIGESEYVQAGPEPPWFTVKVRPPTVTDPLRGVLFGFAPTE